ncbi:MAG: exodeoxyribonuclease V subunit beta [Deltaproteobacteria bacterium]
MKPLDLANTPLEGINLIEASAGTGKTYAIEGLFLRLILEKQMRVDQILVELRDRIRGKLRLAEKTFATGTGEDNLLFDLMQRQKDHAAAVGLIHDALVEFDKAPIFTIHGFCARILYEHAFETANLFDSELISDQTELVRDIAEDFWRRHFYDAPQEFISYFANKIKDPAYFRKLLNKSGATEFKIIPQVEKPSLKSLFAFRNAYQRLKKHWPAARDAVIEALHDPALSGTYYGSLKPAANDPAMTKRDLKILSMTEAMDKYTAANSSGFPLFENFDNFTTQKLKKATRKKESPPSHDFFATCDEVCLRADALQAELEDYFIYLKVQLFDDAPAALKKRKSEKNIQFFDDLLILVKKALVDKKGNPLAAAVRQKYKAALVDEFQDTDSVQYEIFSRLFSAGDSLLFMIGDPKQAIYSFRGADIFSYLKAAQNAQAKFTLTKNWRSKPHLITAVNTLFSNLKTPFLFEGIPFENACPGIQDSNGPAEKVTPLTIWYLDSRVHSDANKPINKTEAVWLIAAAVAEEICRIVTVKAAGWQPGDIAVLVRTNRQAQQIKARLSAKGLPSVLYSTGNIFDSHEAMQIEKILLGISEPDNPGYLKAALAMNMMGVCGKDLLSGNTDGRQWEDRLASFREYYRVWQQSGFTRMFQMVLSREKIRQRLLAFPDGERQLTNVLHLAEIIHQESTRLNLGISGVLKWLAEQRDPQSPRIEEHQLRLESDEDAVKIVTIHKSKGLEYPVVFCPYGWEGSLINDPEIVFHQQGKGDDSGRLTLDLGSDARALNLIQAQNELLAENIRLLYVALTRAKAKCYLTWGNINSAESSALAYLLHTAGGLQIDDRIEDIVGELRRQVRRKSDADRIAELDRLVKNSQGSIEVTTLPESSTCNFFEQSDAAEPMIAREFSGTIDHTWRVSSYSSLVSRRIIDIDQPDRDALGSLFRHLEGTTEDRIDSRKSGRHADIFSFPRGARAGNFFHEILEHLDYTDCSPLALNEPVQHKLQAYGFDSTWQDIVCEAIAHVLSVSLRPDQPQLALSSIAFKQRVNEMEFYFPLNTISPQKLRSVFKKYSRFDSGEELPDRLGKLAFHPVAGFMKGYMDLVFLYRDRFYLVDWKSNDLGPTIDSYGQAALQDAMEQHFYILQYHLYVLALNQYLRMRHRGFQYASDFGGVFYLFIRGIDSRRGPEYGIYFDLPKPELLNALGKVLMPGFAEI